MKTYTISKARQNFFKIVKGTNKSNQPTQITFHTKGQAQNSNVYVVSQKQYQLINKKNEAEKIQRGLDHLTRYAIKHIKPTSEKEFKREIGL